MESESVYKPLIGRAKKAGVGEILIADPGRWPFDDLDRIPYEVGTAGILYIVFDEFLMSFR